MRYVGGLGNMAICWCHWADAFVRHRGSLWELSVSTLEDVGDPVLGEEDNPGHMGPGQGRTDGPWRK